MSALIITTDDQGKGLNCISATNAGYNLRFTLDTFIGTFSFSTCIADSTQTPMLVLAAHYFTQTLLWSFNQSSIITKQNVSGYKHGPEAVPLNDIILLSVLFYDLTGCRMSSLAFGAFITKPVLAASVMLLSREELSSGKQPSPLLFSAEWGNVPPNSIDKKSRYSEKQMYETCNVLAMCRKSDIVI